MATPIAELPPAQRRAALMSLCAWAGLLGGGGLLIWGLNYDVSVSGNSYVSEEIVNLSLLQHQSTLIECGLAGLIMSVTLFAASAVVKTIVPQTDQKSG